MLVRNGGKQRGELVVPSDGLNPKNTSPSLSFEYQA